MSKMLCVRDEFVWACLSFVERSFDTRPTRSSSAKSICATLYDGKKEDMAVGK